jgi:hypothetical protein
VYGVLCSYPVLITSYIISKIGFHFANREWTLIIATVYLLYGLWVFFVRLTRNSLIYARNADSLESFFIRNKDKLLTDAIKAVIGIVFGILIQRYFHLLK